MLLELLLRLAWSGGAIPAFERVAMPGGDLLRPNRMVARRYFTGQDAPPAPPADLFRATKPSRALRLFVLGESTAAGFPYPRNGTFSRALRDALQDVLPRDTVEVVNLGIAATNSYTVADLAGEVLRHQPDAVLVYAGHNEYYGALGTGSSVGIGAPPPIVRASLRAQRLRTYMALRAAAARVGAALRTPPQRDSTVATLMESIARDQEIRLGSPAYEAGLRQYRDNMTAALRELAAAGVPVYIASIASNMRSQPPFVSPANGEAKRAWEAGTAALARGDTASARGLLRSARDADVVRFRAPSALNEVVRDVARNTGARYVPVAERFDSLSPGGMPGPELFLEHVHPNARGYAVIAQVFYEALERDGLLGRVADRSRLATWTDYQRRMELTAFDERIVEHTVRTVTTRWPFVDRARMQDYRGTVRPRDAADSLALLVSRGGLPWAAAKLRMAALHERAGDRASALAEYRGLARDAPYLAPPHLLVGQSLLALGRPVEAIPPLERSLRLAPSPQATFLLGVAAFEAGDAQRAIALLDRATDLAPRDPAPPFQLSRAFAKAGNLDAARAAAARATSLDPLHPGLAEWTRALAQGGR